MTSGQVNASFSSPKWQAVKMIFFAPWDSAIQHLNSWCQLLFNLPTLHAFFELKSYFEPWMLERYEHEHDLRSRMYIFSGSFSAT